MGSATSIKRNLSTLESFLKNLRADRSRIRVAHQEQLYRHRPRAQFHATPEIFFQTGGATDFDCPGDRFRLATGNICVMPRGVSHIETPVDLKSPYSIMVCTYRPDGIFFIRALSPSKGMIRGIEAEPLASRPANEAFFYLDRMAASNAITPDERKRHLRNLTDAFLVTVIGELKISGNPPSHETPSSKVRQATQLAKSNLADPSLSVASLASSLGCSPDHLSRLFHHETGHTLGAWILKERVDMARQLLENSPRNVSEICWACGFNAPSYFIRVFRRHTGMTPRKFRQKASL